MFCGWLQTHMEGTYIMLKLYIKCVALRCDITQKKKTYGKYVSRLKNIVEDDYVLQYEYNSNKLVQHKKLPPIMEMSILIRIICVTRHNKYHKYHLFFITRKIKIRKSR